MRRRASCPGAWPNSCAGRAAPRSPRPGMSGPYLKLGAGEAHAGERRNQTILADVCEADHRRGLHRRRLRGRAGPRRARFRRNWLEAPRRAAARPEERAAGMGAGARPPAADLFGRRADRAGPRAQVPGRREGQGLRRRVRLGHVEAHCGTGGGAEPSHARGRLDGGRRMEQPEQTGTEGAASSPSSARRMPASRPCSTRSSAPRSRSSRARCRRRGRWCAASPSRARRRSSSSTRPASSSRSAASTGPW